VLQEWVSGQSLTVAGCDPELARRCGVIHAALHCTPLPDETRAGGGDGSVRIRQNELERSARALVTLGILSRREERRLLDLAISRAPERADVGLIHGDFCGENIVVGAPGQVSIVDSELVSIGAFDYDLGRTWYRWPMTDRQRDAYCDGYQRYRSFSDFAEHFLYWVTLVLVEAALFRIRAGTQDAWLPVGQLKALLQKPEQAKPGPVVSITP
jgi:aminoglycoside phosphotransferase (APT) family kinase protein